MDFLGGSVAMSALLKEQTCASWWAHRKSSFSVAPCRTTFTTESTQRRNILKGNRSFIGQGSEAEGRPDFLLGYGLLAACNWR
jgi:hypothetical protein